MALFLGCWLITDGCCILWWLFVWRVVKRYGLLPAGLCGILVQRSVTNPCCGLAKTVPTPVQHVLARVFFATPAPIIPDGKPSAACYLVQRHPHSYPLVMTTVWVDGFYHIG